MGTGEWVTLGIGAAMSLTIVAMCFLGSSAPGACPTCLHDDSSDAAGKCLNSDSYTGWGSDRCTCADPYHVQRQTSSASSGP